MPFLHALVMLERMGADLPRGIDAIHHLPGQVHMPRDYCEEDLDSACVADSACTEGYKDSAKAVAHTFMKSRYQSPGKKLQAGLHSDAGSMYGVQVGGFLNRGSVSGLALTAVADLHEDINGLQLGLYNRAEQVRGLRVGLVNLAASLTGMQLGLVNFSHHGGIPFMILLNIGVAR